MPRRGVARRIVGRGAPFGRASTRNRLSTTEGSYSGQGLFHRARDPPFERGEGALSQRESSRSSPVRSDRPQRRISQSNQGGTRSVSYLLGGESRERIRDEKRTGCEEESSERMKSCLCGTRPFRYLLDARDAQRSALETK